MGEMRPVSSPAVEKGKTPPACTRKSTALERTLFPRPGGRLAKIGGGTVMELAPRGAMQTKTPETSVGRSVLPPTTATVWSAPPVQFTVRPAERLIVEIWLRLVQVTG